MFTNGLFIGFNHIPAVLCSILTFVVIPILTEKLYGSKYGAIFRF